MSTGNLNVDLLIKLMRLTASDNDAEALLAARKANEHIAKLGWDWERLLLGKVKVAADPFATVPMPPNNSTQYGAAPPPQYYQPEPPPKPTAQWTQQTYTSRARARANTKSKLTVDDLDNLSL